MIQIPYRAYPIPADNKLDSKKSSFLRPVVDLTLPTPDGGQIGYSAIIDSGADYCLFHGDIGEQLGLEVKKGKALSFYGTGGRKQTAYFHEITFFIEGEAITSTVGFSYGIGSISVGLLGQNGFFDTFKIEFDLKHQTISLVTY